MCVCVYKRVRQREICECGVVIQREYAIGEVCTWGKKERAKQVREVICVCVSKWVNAFERSVLWKILGRICV